ncbi:beta-glucosidase [Spirochaeta africana]|uniref:Beta-glucosidase-like glycosyl hydrolase n=1 Tax=Spirochaeta africana (strain ATCC 700263 / DSM 8902 / Z-7692) TaxID=889378 RepID=H9UFV3_SPIAZ|nr:glycoside hydrolase family 3 C-terminal domain-containing protein [Spirochaeta africana]AFG36396.1 beta-glucosidase-like glycosyl hydrolase [Spirochaeta africana DSM 8902]
MNKLTIQQIAALSSGATAWSTRSCPEIGISDLTMSDGPHGVRKTLDAANLDYSIPATAFPTTACLANSWDVELVEQVGAAIARECRELGVQILLGPGLNIKRSPLGGRNFEYYAEDPVVSGILAGAFIRGLQSNGVAATIKHFAANNAEYHRMTINAVVDERTLREIYLRGFEIAINTGKPWALMTAYNKLNGQYCSEHERLLTGILRQEWGYDGLIMSDWTAVDSRPAALVAGLDLEMPGPSPHNDQNTAEWLAETTETGARTTSEQHATRQQEIASDRKTASQQQTSLALQEHHPAVQRSIAALRKLGERVAPRTVSAAASLSMPTAAANHELAGTAAAAGIVLLKNHHRTLPLEPDTVARLAVIGRFAREPRFQGGGSSQMNPTSLQSTLAEAEQQYQAVQYAEGYSTDGTADRAQIDQAAHAAAAADAVLLLVGLPESCESEGFDRTSLALPAGQSELIAAVCAAQPRTVVAIVAGSPVATDWRDLPAGILYAGLAGQGSGRALLDVVTGRCNPRGRLTESFPERIEDTPCYLNFPGEHTEARYGEGVFVGYRYYETVGVKTAFPFGFGLSYTEFTYSDPSLTTVSAILPQDTTYRISVNITNTGDREGTEVVQLYVSPPATRIRRPVRELRGFCTARLEPGETRRVELTITARDLCYWDTRCGCFAADPGTYQLQFGRNAADIRHSYPLELPHRIGRAPVLDEWSSMGEWLQVEPAVRLLETVIPEEFLKRLQSGTRPTDQMFRNMPLKKMAQLFPERTTPQQLVKLARQVGSR